jgi:hypothetical protein
MIYLKDTHLIPLDGVGSKREKYWKINFYYYKFGL